ncbi:MAG: hypothetical protein CL885_01555, partial [Dehalococcoidia bacterium]|nr:hypothetical protein [Dehalococcoidia bacterium]
SDGVNVSVVQPVVIVSQPEDVSVISGESTLFRVTATGTEPITYQWYNGDEPIPNSNVAELSLTSVDVSLAGQYHVVVGNPVGEVSSKSVSLVIESPPVISQLTDHFSLLEGESAEISVEAVGTAPVTYQWNKGGVEMEGETSPVLRLDNVVPSDGDDYMVAVSNGAGRVESKLISVTVVQPVSIVAQPKGGKFVAGERVELSVVASGTEPITYQWYLGGSKLEGETGEGLKLESISNVDEGLYKVEVANHAGIISSENVMINVISPPVIKEFSKSQSAVEGSVVALRVDAQGAAPLSY